MMCVYKPKSNLWPRLCQHWMHPHLRVRHYLPTLALHQLTNQISFSEQQHNGQIRFVIESNLATADLCHHVTARQRAQYWFAHLGVWNTTQRNGILVYVLFADRAVEILADRGINGCVPVEKWQYICGNIIKSFQQQQYVEGLQLGLEELTRLLAQYFPPQPFTINELPDEVILH